MDVKEYEIEALAHDVTRLRSGTADSYFVGASTMAVDGASWALVHASDSMDTASLLAAAAARFGEDSRPAAIFLTHGHVEPDALGALLRVWDVPVFTHSLELGFLTDVQHPIRALPSDGAVPGLPDWRWLHARGHTPGHISLFREADHLTLGTSVTAPVHRRDVAAGGVRWGMLSGVAAAAVAGTWAYRRFGRKTTN